MLRHRDRPIRRVLVDFDLTRPQKNGRILRMSDAYGGLLFDARLCRDSGAHVVESARVPGCDFQRNPVIAAAAEDMG